MLKVVQGFCIIRKPIYDFLLVSSCNLTFISSHFQDIALWRKLKHHTGLSPLIEGTAIKFHHKLTTLKLKHFATITWKLHQPFRHYTLASLTQDGQTTYHEIPELCNANCNVRLKIERMMDDQSGDNEITWAGWWMWLMEWFRKLIPAVNELKGVYRLKLLAIT